MMSISRIKYCVPGIFLLLSQPVLAQSIELSQSPSGQRQPGDSIQVLLAGEPSKNLLFELDGLDVTALVRFQPGQAVVTPSQQLKTGPHQLTVYQLVGETLQTLSVLPFQVAAEPGFSLANVAVQSALNVSYPLLRHGPAYASSQSTWQADGVTMFDGQWGRRDWEVKANANVFFDTLRGRSTGLSGGSEQSVVDLGDFLLSAKKGNLSGKIGHHAMGERGLVLNNFRRRGVSIGWQTRNKRYAVTGFSFSSEPITGFRHGLGIGSKRTRVTGSTATAKPFAAGSDTTTLNLTWITGETQGLQTASIVQENRIKAGNAVGLEASSLFFNQRVKVRGEFARSNYDFDGRQVGQAATQDDAHVIGLKFNPIVPDYANNKTQTLELGLEQRHIGTFFRSLANPGLPADLDSTRSYARYSNLGVALQVSLEKQNNNSGDSPLLPTIGTRLQSATLRYTPMYNPGEKPGMMGRPSVGLTWSQSEQKTQYVPVNYPFQQDTSTQQTTVFSSFAHEQWNWNINLSRGEISDALGVVPGSNNTLLGLGLNWRPGKTTQLGGQWQYSHLTTDTGPASDQYVMNLNLSLELVPKKLAANGRFSWHEQKAEDVVQNRSSTMDLGMSWILRSAKSNKAGLTLWLRGQYNQRQRVLTTANSNSYQALVGLTLDYQK